MTTAPFHRPAPPAPAGIRRALATRTAALAAAATGWALMASAFPAANGAFVLGMVLSFAGCARVITLAGK